MKLPNWIFCYYSLNSFTWFRIFGFGLVIKDIEKHNLLFSERNNLRIGFKYKNYYIRFLKYKLIC